MNSIAVLRTALKSSQHLLTWIVSDLSDADLLVRPVPGSNHVAWQLGHLILSERSKLLPFTYPELPAGFAAQHTKETAPIDPPVGFPGRQEYVALFNSVRDVTVAGVEGLSEADLDRPIEGPMAAFAPTLGAMLLLISNHALMHAGQFSVVRRKLGKPVLF